MIKQSRWLSVALIGLAVCAAVFLFKYLSPESQQTHQVALPGIDVNIGQEPITPIPLVLNLDIRKVALGRRLFHDAQLSHDNKISCAYCHNLAKGGTDGLQHAIGINGKANSVNTLTVFNSGFNFRFFWDGRAATLEDQIDSQLNNPCELGSTWEEVVDKLEKDATYRRDFSAIYPEGIKQQTIKDAIVTFVRSLTTPNSKFDRFLRGDQQALNNIERAGYDLFKSLGCISCHQGMNVGGNLYEKIGLIEDYFAHRGNMQEADFGRYNVTHDEADRYKFRVPSLRNVALTAPYLHDGSAKSLEAVVAIMGKYQLGVDLRADEIGKIISFLNTLTGEFRVEEVN